MSVTALMRSFLRQAAVLSPSVAILGGDLAYENSIPACYERMDDFIDMYQTEMLNPAGELIPFLSAIGTRTHARTHCVSLTEHR